MSRNALRRFETISPKDLSIGHEIQVEIRKPSTWAGCLRSYLLEANCYCKNAIFVHLVKVQHHALDLLAKKQAESGAQPSPGGPSGWRFNRVVAEKNPIPEIFAKFTIGSKDESALRRMNDKNSSRPPTYLFSACGYVGRSVPIIWLCMFIAILFAGLKPFRFHPDNGARWIGDHNGIRFERPRGLAFSQERLSGLLGECREGCSIEMVVSPEQIANDDPSYILNDDEGGGGPSIAVMQVSADLVLQARFKSGGTEAVQMNRIGAANVFRTGRMTDIAITTAPLGTELYVNGRLTTSSPKALDVNGFTHRVLLGASGSCNYPWFGELLGLAFYDRPLTSAEVRSNSVEWDEGRPPHAQGATALYTFAERGGEQAHGGSSGAILDVPAHLMLLHRVILKWDMQLTREGTPDVVFNVIGLIPFGFVTVVLLCVRFNMSQARAFCFSIATAALLSLSIELIQAYIPGRASSSADLLMNTIGATIGTVGAITLFRLTTTFRAWRTSSL
jgi:hypothetical protein